jgi:hypothetical protein
MFAAKSSAAPAKLIPDPAVPLVVEPAEAVLPSHQDRKASGKMVAEIDDDDDDLPDLLAGKAAIRPSDSFLTFVSSDSSGSSSSASQSPGNSS